jgi:RNA polymerase sigma-70 factor (ECF subfamily)
MKPLPPGSKIHFYVSLKRQTFVQGEQMPEEKELLLQIAGGSHTAFREIFDRYFDRIYGVAYSLVKSPMIAEDMTQDIFLKIWEKREMLTDVQKLDAYLFRVARNHILNEFRNKVKEQDFSEYLCNFFRETADNPEQHLIFTELEEVVSRAVEHLPPQQREIYRLCREDGLRQEEIAEKLQISVNTIKQHMNRALKFIRHYYLSHYRLVLMLVIERALNQ